MRQTYAEPVAFGDGRYQLGPLSLKHLAELERACGVRDAKGNIVPKSVYQVYDEIAAGLGVSEDGQALYFGGGAAHASDIYHVIRLALIAGNSGVVGGQQVEVGPVKAADLCDSYLYPHRPLVEGQHLAWTVLHAALVGVEPKKKEARSPSRRKATSPST